MKKLIYKVLYICANVFVAWVCFNTLSNPAALEKISHVKVVPAVIVGANLFWSWWWYNLTSFIFRVVDGQPDQVENMGGIKAYKEKMDKITTEINAELRKEGRIPFYDTLAVINSNATNTQLWVWVSEAIVAIMFILMGWFWAGLSYLVSIAVSGQCLFYLFTRAKRIQELADM